MITTHNLSVGAGYFLVFANVAVTTLILKRGLEDIWQRSAFFIGGLYTLILFCSFGARAPLALSAGLLVTGIATFGTSIAWRRPPAKIPVEAELAIMLVCRE